MPIKAIIQGLLRSSCSVQAVACLRRAHLNHRVCSISEMRARLHGLQHGTHRQRLPRLLHAGLAPQTEQHRLQLAAHLAQQLLHLLHAHSSLDVDMQGIELRTACEGALLDPRFVTSTWQVQALRRESLPAAAP